MSTYARHAACTNGHWIEVLFDWDPVVMRGELKEYSKPCPVPECGGRVEFALPIGSDPDSLKLIGP
jgi:hypothetical protein